MVGPKKQAFWPRINILKGNLKKKSFDELRFVKKCQNRTFKVNFECQKLIEFFQKKFLSKNINLGNHYLVKTFFSKLNFWTTLLSKITPNFWRTDILRRNLKKKILGGMLILCQKTFFLGPTIFKIPQPNWYYYICKRRCEV